MFRSIHILKHQVGLLFRNGDFIELLDPGTHWVLPWNAFRDKVEIVDTLKTMFEHGLLDALVENPDLRDALHVLDLADGQRAIVWKDDRLLGLFGPGRYAFWKKPARIDIEVFSVDAFMFKHPRLQAILASGKASAFLDGVMVSEQEDVLLFRDGVLVERLGPGLHVYWKGTGKIDWKSVDRREQVADVAGQEIMTADKVTLRVNLLVSYVIADALRAIQSVQDYTQTIYREAQLALRAAVGLRTLDALLADKEAVGGEVQSALATRLEPIGVSIRGVGLRDIILPGDMKLILNQVISAQKEAEANLIKRREETAAARSQANTAKLLAENPLLARLKELEMLQGILAGTKTTFVFGSGEMAEQVRSLIRSDDKG